jgi:hypothetical protein
MAGSAVIPLTISIQCVQFHSSTRTRVLCGHSATVFALFAEIAFGDNFRDKTKKPLKIMETFSLNSILIVEIAFPFLQLSSVYNFHFSQGREIL